jgi:hypothetical protein
MSVAKSYFEHVEGQTELEVVPWDDPEEITVVERQLSPEEFEAIRRRIEEASR